MSGRAKDIELLAGEYGTDEAGAERLYEEGIRPSGAASHDFVPADPAHDEFVKDRVCPRCSSRLKLDRKDNYIYCSSDTCPYFQALPFTASQLKVTGGENPTSPTNNMGGGDIQPNPPVTNQTGGREMEDLEKKLDEAPEIYPNWEPAAGDKLVGEVIRKDMVKGFDMLVVKPKNGEARTVWKITTLRDLFEKVKVGDRVGLKYLGEMKSEKGRNYKNIRFVLEAKQG